MSNGSLSLELLSQIRELENDLRDAAHQIACAQYKLNLILTLNDPMVAVHTLYGGLRLLDTEYQAVVALLKAEDGGSVTNKIPAIKALRSLRDISLFDAKQIIEKLAEDLNL
jgi:ribosomal protein L7/L12